MLGAAADANYGSFECIGRCKLSQHAMHRKRANDFLACADILPIVAYDKNGVIAKFEFVKTPGNLSLTQINVTITSSKMYPLSNFALLAAVPKVSMHEFVSSLLCMICTKTS